jgi:hypothetical protein
MQSEYPHRGITMHKLPVGDNFPGLIFAVGSALIFLFAIPALWYVLVAAVAIGLVVAALLQIVHREHPDEMARVKLLG